MHLSVCLPNSRAPILSKDYSIIVKHWFWIIIASLTLAYAYFLNLHFFVMISQTNFFIYIYFFKLFNFSVWPVPYWLDQWPNGGFHKHLVTHPTCKTLLIVNLPTTITNFFFNKTCFINKIILKLQINLSN